MNPARAEARSAKSKSAAERKDRWWLAGEDMAAAQLAAWCDNIERVSWARRWNNLAFYRYMTGRPTPPSTYNYATTSRPSSVNVYSRAVFESPRYNVLRQCSDALANRVYKNRPFLQVCPIAGDFKARVKAKQLTRFIDAAFFDLKLWPIIEQCGEDCRIWGSSFLKVDVGIDGEITATRVLQDEVIVDDNETNAGEPRHMAIRVFVNRDDMAARFEDQPEALDAIRRAPKSTNGFYFGGDLDCTDVIVLREAWALPVGKKGKKGYVPGRHVLSVGDYCFTDEKYHRNHFPLAKLTFKQVSTGWFGMGMPEMVMGMQREVDRMMGAFWENMRRNAWPRIGIFAGSNVTPGQLADKSNGIYTASSPALAPKFELPASMSSDQYQYFQMVVTQIKETFRLNDQQAQSQKPRLTSGIAIVKQDEIDDAAHIDIALHLEDFVEQVGYLIVEAAEICKPSVTLPGRKIQQIAWADVNIARDTYSLRAFPVGRLSQSMAVRQQQIDNWFAEGQISRAIKMRLEQVPDIDGYQDLANASLDYIEMAIDNLIETNEYEPCEPWCDLQAALQTSQSRYLFEKQQKTPRDKLDKILMWMNQVQEMLAELAPPPMPGIGVPGMPAPPPGFGVQPPGGPAPAPSPFPIAPPNAAPPPVQATA